jgi:stage V sporulation protein G
MEITEVKVILKEGPDKKLKAYATLTFDDSFVVRNVKVIKGNKGLFVAMPSRKMREACPKCHYKNAIRSKYCNQCGSGLPVPDIREMGPEGKHSEHRDIAHPITLECREYIQGKVLAAYEAELNRSGSPISTPERPSFEKREEPEEPEEPEETATDAPPAEEGRPGEDPGDIRL